MKLHHILDDVFGSKSKVRILRIMCMYPEKDLTEREIARYIGMSQNTVNKSLADLARTNILSYRRVGRANAYMVDKESALFPFLNKIFEEEKRIRKELMQRLKEATSHFLSTTLFGGFANKTENYKSDVHLLVIVKNKKEAEVKIQELENDLLRLFNLSVAPILYTPSELQKKWNAPFIKKIRKSGILIGGKSLDEVYGKRD